MNWHTPVIISLLLGSTAAWAQNPSGMALEQLLEIGLDNNSNIRIAERNLHTAQAAKRGSFSGLVPSLQTAIYRDMDPRETYNQDGTLRVPQAYSSSYSISQTIFDGAQSWYNAASGSNQVAAAEASFDQARLQAALAIKEAYYGYLSREALLGVSGEALSLSEKQLELVQERFNLQAVRETDLLKAKVSAGQRRAEVYQARQSLATSATQLNVALGLEPLSPFNLAAQEVIPDPIMDRAVATALLVQNNPLLQGQVYAVKGAWLSAKMQRGVLMPTVRISYSANALGSDLGSVFDSGALSNNSRTNLSLSIPLFAGLRNTSSYRRARYSAMAEEERLDGLERDLRRQLENTISYLESLHEVYPINQEVLASAEADIRLAEEQYNLGAISILDLLNAQVSLITAKSTLVRTMYDIKIAEAQLAALTGSLIE